MPKLIDKNCLLIGIFFLSWSVGIIGGMMPKLFTRNFVSIFLASLFTANCFYILMAVLPLLITEQLGYGKTQIGIAIGSFAITAVFMRPFTGFLLDNTGRLKVYRPALLLFALCVEMYVFVALLPYKALTVFIMIVILRMAHGMAWGVSSTAGSTLAADIVPKERRAEGLGYYSMAMNVGMALGPVVGIAVLYASSFYIVFVCCLVLAILAACMGFIIKMPDMVFNKSPFKPTALIEKRVMGIAIMQLFFGIAYGSIMSFAIVYGEQMGIIGTGYFFMIFAVVVAIMRPLTGKYLDRNGPGNVMGLGLLLTMAGLIFLALIKGSTGYFVVAFILGMGTGIVSPLLVAMAMNVVPPQRRGAANATIFTAFDLGIGGGAIILGVTADRFSTSTMYLIACMILIVPLVYYYTTYRKQYEVMAEETKAAEIKATLY